MSVLSQKIRLCEHKGSRFGRVGAGTLWLMLTLSGCSLNDMRTDRLDNVRDTVAREDQAQASFEQRPAYPARDRAIHLPRDALWLGQTRAVHFTEPVPARSLVRALLAGHPVRFAMTDPNDSPLIYPATASLILKDYLDSVAVQANWHYAVVDGVVVFSDWQVATIPIASVVGHLTGTLSSTTGVTDSAIFNHLVVDTDPYVEIERLVANILTAGDADPASETAVTEPRKATFSVSKAANQLTVSARPNQVRALEKTLGTFNASVSRRVVFHVLLYDVALNDGEERSLDIAVLADLTRLSARLRGALPNTALIGDSLSIVNLETTGVRHSPLDLQGLLLNWIQTRGTVAHRMQRRFEALNNRPVTFLDTTEIEYVKGVEVTTPEGGGPATITETLGTHQVGRAFALHATIVDDRVNVQMTINRRTARPKPRSEEGVSVLYDIDNIDRVLPLSLRDGETRVLTHFSSNDSQLDQSRNRLLPWIGDGKKQRQTLIETVIAISAEIVE